MKIKHCAFILFTCLSGMAFCQTGPKQVKLTHFELQSSAIISQSGEQLSTADYKSNVHWFPVIVPSTVLTGLVANRVYPDPYSGMNNMLIPDASDAFNKQYNLEQFSHLPNNPNPWKKPYWYRTVFKVPQSDKDRHFELIFKGINYRAAVWLNGKPIADSTQMAGMFAEYSMDVSKQINAGGDNVLAVKIYPLDYPGLSVISSCGIPHSSTASASASRIGRASLVGTARMPSRNRLKSSTRATKWQVRRGPPRSAR